MARNTRKTLNELCRQTLIDRSLYLEAVRRHDDRVEAIWRANSLGAIADPIPDSALPAAPSDSAADIARDDRIIELFLAENPPETRRPFARGNNLDEIEKNWKQTDHYARRRQRHEADIATIAKRVARKYIE